MKKLTTIAALVGALFASPAFASNMLCPNALSNYVDSQGTNHATNAQAITLAVTGQSVLDLTALGCQRVSPATTVSAATDPTTTNDNTQGFAIGSLWVNSTGPKVWTATAVGTGAATWTQTGNSITSGTNLQAGASGTAGAVDIYPATAAYGKLHITNSPGNVGAYDTTLNLAAQGQASTITIPDPGNSTASVVLTKGTQTISGAITLSAASTALAVTNNETVGGTLGVTGTTTAAAINASGLTTTTGGLVSIVTNDFHTPYSTGLTANPVSMTTYGTCLVAAVNGGTCIPLAGVTSRTITVTHFDIVAAGSAATCTGVLLEDTNNTPVVIATLAAATLTSAAHNVPLAATLGVGFGAGSGLTVAKGVQLIKNGSDCSTTTAFNYAITYTVQ